MRKIVMAAFALSMLAVSCKKESGNSGVIKQENSEVSATDQNAVASGETKEETYRYVAEDGSSALVKFTNSSKDGNYISITSNKKTIKVKQKETTPNGAVYEENSVLVKSEGDNITIEQGGNVIELKKARGQ